MMINPLVQEIGEIHFEGNIIPHTWYQHPLLRTSAGRKRASCAHTHAILILSDIIYWYRPWVVRDEETGRILEVKQKFLRDKLQKSYPAWAKLFGLSAKQVRDAVNFLKVRGLIRTELRTLVTPAGEKLPNRMFVEPVVEMIRRINVEVVAVEEDEEVGDSGEEDLDEEREGCDDKVIPSDFKVTPSALEGRPSDHKVRGSLPQSQITENTTETTPKIRGENTHTPSTGSQKWRAKQQAGRRALRRGVSVRSRYSLEECVKYAEHQRSLGKGIDNPEGLAVKLYETGSADALIGKFLTKEANADSTRNTQSLTANTKINGSGNKHPPGCSGCYGSGMEVVEGKGARKCTQSA